KMSTKDFFKIYFFPSIMTYLFFGFCFFFPDTFSKHYPTFLIIFSFPHFIISYYLWWKNREGLAQETSVWLAPIIFWASLIYFSTTENIQAIEMIVQLSYLYL